MHFVRQFCDPGTAPYCDVAVRQTRTTRNDTQLDIVAPADWPLSTAAAVAALALDRFGGMANAAVKAGALPPFLCTLHEARTEGGAITVLGVLDRLAARWTGWGWRLGLFDQAADAEAFFDDIRWLLVQRALAPDAIAWAGLSGAPRLRGFGVDPFTGKTAPAHALADFAPVTAAADAGPVGNVVRLIRDTVESRADKAAKATLPAPVVTLDLMRFIGHSGAVDAAALAHAARLATLVAEIELATRLARSEAEARSVYANRPIAVGPANLGALLMAQGLAHDSAAGRALAQATVGLITAAVAAMSGEIAAEAGPCPGFTTAKRPLTQTLKAQAAAMQRALARVGAVARPVHLGAMAAAIERVTGPLWAQATLAVGGQGLRHSRFTALQTIAGRGSMPIDQQSVGAKPLPALMCDQELGNGQITTMVAPAVTAGLGMLGHDVAVQAAAIRHLRGRRSLADAPGVSLAALRTKGLDEAALARIEAAVMETDHIRHVFNRWIIGAETCDTVLGLDPERTQDYGFDMLAALGFTADQIEAANRHCLGADSLAGTPGLAMSDARALAVPGDSTAALRAETAMIKALNMVLSVPTALPEDDGAEQAEDKQGAASAAPAHALAAADRA